MDMDAKAVKELDDLFTPYAMSTFRSYWNSLRQDYWAGMWPLLSDVKTLTTKIHVHITQINRVAGGNIRQRFQSSTNKFWALKADSIEKAVQTIEWLGSQKLELLQTSFLKRLVGLDESMSDLNGLNQAQPVKIIPLFLFCHQKCWKVYFLFQFMEMDSHCY